MALAITAGRSRLIAPPKQTTWEVPVRRQRPNELNPSAMRATAWSGAGLAVVAVLGLLEAPGMKIVWIVMLVFSVLSVPQGLLAARLQEKKQKGE
jgi:hypothetical protein